MKIEDLRKMYRYYIGNNWQTIIYDTNENKFISLEKVEHYAIF